MITLLLTLIALFSPTGESPADVELESIEPAEQTVTRYATPQPDPFPELEGVVYEPMHDERIDAATGEILLVPLGGIPYDGPVDEAGVPIQ